MTHPNAADAHSILPLAVLEAMRNLDSPSDEEVAEYVDELLKKRLGLSETVAAQIARYEAVVKRDGTVAGGEFEQLLRLVSRRTDATLAFGDGGRRAARRAVGRLPGLARWATRRLPRFLSRRIGFRAARRAAGDVLAVTLTKEAGVPVAVLPGRWPVDATPDGAACTFFAAALAELLRHTVEFEGAMTHTRCRARGDAVCEWRAGGAAGAAGAAGVATPRGASR